MSGSVPGSAGLPLLGDRSYEFYKDPIQFLHKYSQQAKSRVFLSRFLNKPTIFVGSNSVLKQLLNEHEDSMMFGYKMFMEDIFGDNILFMDGESAMSMRETLGQLFTEEAVATYQHTINRIVSKSLSGIPISEPICVYEFFKKLALEICLSLFLDVDFDKPEAKVISELTTTHWHGIISVPVSVKLPYMSASTYSKALEAKKALLCEIERRRGQGCHSFPEQVGGLAGLSQAHVNNHLLLFTSALVPKALSSILTSFCTMVASPEYAGMQDELLEDQDQLERVMLEVLRLYPPFLGGRRVITKDILVDGLKLPEGVAVVFMTYMAQRDPAVFDNPDAFDPGRWQSKNKDDRDKLFCFGSGPRRCLGQKLIWSIINTVLQEVLSQFRLRLEPGQDLAHKWLPVSRPRGNILMTFEPRSCSGPAETS